MTPVKLREWREQATTSTGWGRTRVCILWMKKLWAKHKKVIFSEFNWLQRGNGKQIRESNIILSFCNNVTPHEINHHRNFQMPDYTPSIMLTHFKSNPGQTLFSWESNLLLSLCVILAAKVIFEGWNLGQAHERARNRDIVNSWPQTSMSCSDMYIEYQSQAWGLPAPVQRSFQMHML